MKDPVRKRDLTKTTYYTWGVRFLALAFVLSAILGSILIYNVVRDLTAGYTGVGLNPFRPVDQGSDETLLPEATPTMVEFVETPQPWDGKARVTILVMGIDYRDWVAGEGSPRSDSMMLVTIDPITMQAGMLSIPRDLWVEIPGFGFNRINAAYAFGEGYRLPGGGPNLAVKTVEKLLGVPIPYYAVIDFRAFERIIDELGGLDIEVAERIKISAIDRHERWLEPGIHHLDGPDTLAYARARKGAGGDFGRAERQQQVIRTVLDHLVTLDMLPTLITRAPALYQELAGGVRTNLALEQIVSMAWLTVRVSQDDIRQGVIGPPKMVGFYTRPSGAQVLRPVPDQIRQLRNYIFVETSAFGP
ncbi:MAG: LCP family protein [Anaerolineaceae bacterium]|nr:MAG: LCP family protein [Anaerolineaceae bacterium]